MSIPAAWEEKFHECLGLEFSDPQYFRVHHILVCTWMIQTGSYGKAFRQEALELLKDFLETPYSVPHRKILELNRRFSSSGRTEPVAGGDGCGESAWPLSIMDVRTGDAETYCAGVLSWARNVLETCSR